MARLIIEGGRPLSGSLRIAGAKNAALPILAAALLSDGEIRLLDCPRIRDVENMLRILEALGVKTGWDEGALRIDASAAHGFVMPCGPSKALRSSIFLLGPLLSRFGCAVCTYPGGCEIGNRPIDLHLSGLSMLGVKIREENGQILCDGQDMHAAEIHLDYPSVGATENIMMAAVCVHGETLIRNAAREPEIEDLQSFLCALGYEVSGAGSSNVRIVGGSLSSRQAEHRVMPDRIVAGTVLAAAAITGGEVVLNNVVPQHMGVVLTKLREMGCTAICARDSVFLSAPERLMELKRLETLPYPGFPTDMQAQMFALCTVARGSSVIVENVFENRFKHGAELKRLGAEYIQKDRLAIIRGVEQLHGAEVNAYDLRGGAALAIAGLRARGITVVNHAEYIDRGYERLEEMLQKLGARMQREDGPETEI